MAVERRQLGREHKKAEFCPVCSRILVMQTVALPLGMSTSCALEHILAPKAEYINLVHEVDSKLARNAQKLSIAAWSSRKFITISCLNKKLPWIYLRRMLQC